jgi:hypothetical protein
MAVFGANIGFLEPPQIERFHASFREAMLIPSDSVLSAPEALARLIESTTEPLAHLTSLIEESWHLHMAEASATIAIAAEASTAIARWNEQMAKVLAPVAHLSAQFAEALAPFLEEQRVAEVILGLGLLPHAEMIRLLANIEKPSEGKVNEISQRIALDLWPKVRPQLGLSLDDCLSDQKIFCSFSDIIRAHDAGLYQLTIPAAASVIERAVRLAQRHEPKPNKPIHWLEVELRELPCTHVHSWRVLSVLTEQTYANCRTDAEADTIPYPNRHAAAHGFGARRSNVVDSFNAVMAAHFIITAASAFEKYTRVRSGPFAYQ